MSDHLDDFEEALQSVRPKVQPRSQSMLEIADADLQYPLEPNPPTKQTRKAKPKKEDTQPLKAVMSRLPVDVAKGIEQQCLDLDVSRDALIEAILRQYLANPTKVIGENAIDIHTQRTLSKERKRARTMGSKFQD